MSFDIFISYSHRDNKPTTRDEPGWVDIFELALDNFLTVFLGREAEIWRDKGYMTGNATLDSILYENLEKSAILIPILSPNYINSQWCPKELSAFYEKKGLAQIFPIVKSPIPGPPAELKDNFLKYEFYIRDSSTPTIREIDPAFGDVYRNKLNLIVSDLAREIAGHIASLATSAASVRPGPSAPLPPPVERPATVSDSRPVIYMAEPSPDLWDQYNDIKRDLEQRGCRFLPLNIDPFQKPNLAEDYKQLVRTDIGKCGVAVHLISGKNNFYPAESPQSYLHLQTEVAAERDADQAFKRLIWFPRDIASDDPKHQKFIEDIRLSASAKVEFLQNSLEDFKTYLQDALKPPPPLRQINPDDPPWVYVLYDQCDMESAGSVEDLLKQNGCQLFSSKEYIDEAGIDANEIHKDYLSKCDSVLIYWRMAKYYWVNNSIFDLQKSKAFRNHDYKTNAVVCDGNLEEEEKLEFRPRPHLLKVAKNGPVPDPLKSKGYSEMPDFLTSLEA